MEKYDIIGDVRDKGLFFAVELVEDHGRRAPATAAAGRLINAMCQRGVLISRIGPHDNVLKLRPPMPFSKANAEQLLDTLDTCLAQL